MPSSSSDSTRPIDNLSPSANPSPGDVEICPPPRNTGDTSSLGPKDPSGKLVQIESGRLVNTGSGRFIPEQQLQQSKKQIHQAVDEKPFVMATSRTTSNTDIQNPTKVNRSGSSINPRRDIKDYPNPRSTDHNNDDDFEEDPYAILSILFDVPINGNASGVLSTGDDIIVPSTTVPSPNPSPQDVDIFLPPVNAATPNTNTKGNVPPGLSTGNDTNTNTPSPSISSLTLAKQSPRDVDICLPPRNTATASTKGHALSGLRKKLRKNKPATELNLGAISVPFAAPVISSPATSKQQVTPNGIKPGLRRTPRERQAKLQARNAHTVDTQHASVEAATATGGKGFQRGLRCTAEERRAKLEARNSQHRTRSPPLNGWNKKAAKRKAAATTPGAEHAGGRGMAPLRGIAKNSELVINGAPSRYGLRAYVQAERMSLNEESYLRLTHVDESSDNTDISPQEPVDEEGRPPSPSPSHPSLLEPTRGNSCLAVARAVEDDTAPFMEAQRVDPEELQRHESRQESKEKKATTCRWAVFAIITICAIVLAITLGLKLGRQDEKALVSTSTVAPEILLENHVLSLLPTYTQESITEDATSPQSKAYNWLVADPHLMTYSDGRIIQRFALGALFHSSNGDRWRFNTNWLSYEVHECEWHAQDAIKILLNIFKASGEPIPEPYFSTVIIPLLNVSFPCEDPIVEKQYTYLWLVANGLKGQLPPEVYLLTSLKHIGLSVNSLTGSALSTEIGKLSSLEGLDLSLNQFSGTMPTEIGLLSGLLGLGLRKNKLSGTLPSQLGQLSDNLMILDLHDNLLVGSIPQSLGALEKMISLLLYENQLSGTIPTCLGQLSEIKWLYLGGNELLGTIPSQLGLLESLEELWLNQNSLTGSVPGEIGNLVLNGSLEIFHIHTNNLTGTLPTDDLCLIDTISDYNNQLTGCNCTCSFVSVWYPDHQLCSPLLNHCTRLL